MTEPNDISLKKQRQISRQIAAELKETEAIALKTMDKLVEVLGIDRALALLAETRQVEVNGGLLTNDGQRRTPGGVYFKLAKDQSTPQDRQRIFIPPKKSQSNIPPPEWEKLVPLAHNLVAQNSHGKADKVKLTVIGRPGKIIEKDSVVMTTIQSTKTPSLPKGLPAVPPKPTTYLVFIALKQWLKVREVINSNPDDKLIIEGYPALDARIGGGTVCLYAQNVTTITTQQARKEAQKAT